MSPESTTSLPSSNTNISKPYSQVHLKRAGKKLLLILPDSEPKEGQKDWVELLQDLKYCLNHHKGTWTPGTAVHLLVENRLMDSRQFHNIGEALDAAELKLTRVFTTRRQTAITAATAGYSVEQETPKRELFPTEISGQGNLNEPLYLKTTVRSGVAIRHPGTIIIQGDVNPGGEVIADGDVIIWGYLRGIAHAGAKGNPECCIMALRMQPTQLRIGEAVARPPGDSPEVFEPEVAYLTTQGIRLKSALNFNKTHIFTVKDKGWTEKNTPNPA
ncbi:septum site-determining protein [Crocosphaera subtropica ATCC 51142]|uniref:Probable septum site-determining protein MinC n=1 Tax=Crocosphaera subtropica (strain ATCC 51142 / BH68) TaxID=43989 RepID=B1WRH5_CROS5|nr:septum site-determining protein MinC [Crocosphaera subtropica]ACB51824.1 septum site-determining protein [Crocosphaera subtropica ATCC 51142]